MTPIDVNLNKLLIEDEDGPGRPLVDHRAVSADGKTTVLFRNLEEELIQRIDRADVVVGCVAWLTSEPILSALAKKAGVAIVVQKEDFLRPDMGARREFKTWLRRLYNAIPSTLTRYDEGWSGTVLHYMSSCGAPGIDPIRCVGNHNADKAPAFPRAHHKFVVFCRRLPTSPSHGNFLNYMPYEVWTGSYNFTKNAENSLENAMVSTDPAIVRAFFNEAAQIQALSEVLNWTTSWSAPEWRIGS